MNRWMAIGLSAVTLVAAVALYFSGHMWPAAIALALSVACDIVFALASRGAIAQRKSP
jgi:uncharacterized membrane protein YiaA